MVGATIDLGIESFDFIVEESLKVGDVITQGIVGIVKDLADVAMV